jgi:hypothetical protein
MNANLKKQEAKERKVLPLSGFKICVLCEICGWFSLFDSRGFASFAGSESLLIAAPSIRGEAPIARE